MDTTTNRIETVIRDTFATKTVTKHKLTLDLGGEKIDTPHYGLFLPDEDWHCIDNAVKEGYTPHTIEDVVAMGNAAAEAFDGDCRVRAHWRDGHYVEITPSDDYRRSIYGTRDNVFPRMYCHAGYDGSAFTGSLGWYRDACRNLSMLRGTGRSATRKLRHTASLSARIEEMIEDFRALAEQWDATVERIEKMESRSVNLADFVRAVYPMGESTRAQANAERRVEAIFERVLRERELTGRAAITNAGNVIVSAWEAYNGVQGYVQHEARRRNSSEWDRALKSFSDASVRKAEELAFTLSA